MKKGTNKPVGRVSPAKSPAELLAEGQRILRELQRAIQFNGQFNGGPGAVEHAVAAMFKLASSATVNCAMAAHSPRTIAYAQEAASRSDWIPVLKGNPKRLPWFAEALNRLETFQTYRSRGPHKKAGDNERGDLTADQALAEWTLARISEFWRGVISRSARIPPIPDSVRVDLLGRKNRLDGRKWAESLLEHLPKEPNNPYPFEVYDRGSKQAFFERQVPERKKSGSDRVCAGFVKYVGERFQPHLEHEIKMAEISYQKLRRERSQTNRARR